jgi:hypothetical protein
MNETGKKAGARGGADARKERLAQALRANLKRRKQAGGGPAKAGKDKRTGGSRDTSG